MYRNVGQTFLIKKSVNTQYRAFETNDCELPIVLRKKHENQNKTKFTQQNDEVDAKLHPCITVAAVFEYNVLVLLS